MEFIKAEEFLGQPTEVQKVLLEWWKCDFGDLYVDNREYERDKYYCDINCVNMNLEGDIEGDWEYFKTISTPILTEGQLRKFIEDKSKCNNIEISGDIETGQYYADFYEEIYSGIEIDTIENLGTDKFKAYWTLALIFVKEEIK